MTIKIGLHDFFGVTLNEVELSPFMIFCGDNGSGKTHLVKTLNSIDNFMRNPYVRGSEWLTVDHLEKIPLEIDYEKINQEGFIDISIKKDDGIYLYLEQSMNLYLNKNKDNILLNTFSNTEEILREISMSFSDKPNLIIKISYHADQDIEEESLVLEDIEKKNEIKFDFKIEGEDSSILTTGIQIVSQNTIDLEEISHIILERFWHHFMRAIYVLNFKLKSRDSYYFPASREAYMRDFSYFLERDKGTNNKMIITEYDLDNGQKRDINTHSNDPYIETHINQMIQAIDGHDQFNHDLISFLEKYFLKIKFDTTQDTHKYILEDDITITPDLGSSLQNEYSFLRILLGKKKSPNIIIEEPEAHLSIKNSVLLAYVLVAIQQRLGNKVWLTTHSNFIVDAINNLIMIAELPSSKQRAYLNKIQIDDILTSVEKESTDLISAYFLEDGLARKLTRGIQGIEYDDFIQQIHDFIDVSTDLQWEVEELKEV